jgi:5'-3' exonuclease
VNVHLVDGTYELFRAFFGAPPAVDASGRQVGAARGFTRSMISLLRDDATTHVAIAFDHVIESFRNRLFDGYKTGEGMDPELWAQFPLAERAAAALGVVVWPMVEFEADDAIATGAVRYAADPRVDRVFMCTPDKDMGQVVSGGRIVMLDRMRKKVLDEEAIRAKFGVGPESIPDYLALVGDTSDGIPGLSKWGAKSSSTLLAEYGVLDAIPDDPTQWTVKVRGAKGLAEVLAASRADAELYRTLARLRTDVPLEESLDDLHWRGADRPALEAFCEEIGDPSATQRVPAWAD